METLVVFCTLHALPGYNCLLWDPFGPCWRVPGGIGAETGARFAVLALQMLDGSPDGGCLGAAQ